LKINTTFAF